VCLRTAEPGLPGRGPHGAPEVIDVFTGGCVTYQPGASTAAELLDQTKSAVTFRTRDELREGFRHHFNGRLELHPEGGYVKRKLRGGETA
jgi:hypothetical protein